MQRKCSWDNGNWCSCCDWCSHCSWSDGSWWGSSTSSFWQSADLGIGLSSQCDTRDYFTSKKWTLNTDLGCKNDAALLTYTFNKEYSNYNESWKRKILKMNLKYNFSNCLFTLVQPIFVCLMKSTDSTAHTWLLEPSQEQWEYRGTV